MAYAGIDVGTSGCKMVVYDEKGSILSSSARSYSQTGTDGYRELDPNLVIKNVKEVIREAASSSKAPRQMHFCGVYGRIYRMPG